MPDNYRQELTKERFLSSLSNLGLQRHLLGVPTPTIEAAVRAGNKYLQLTATHAGPRALSSRTYQLVDEPSVEEASVPRDQMDSIRMDNPQTAGGSGSAS